MSKNLYDYKLLEALAAIVNQGSFESAARYLCISQPAVSQRLKLLEESLGRPLLVRGSPPILTEDGERVMEHFMKVVMLEDEFRQTMEGSEQSSFTRLAVAVNRDTLSLWFFEAISPFLKEQQVVIQIIAEDQDLTHEYLKSGQVFGCISTREKPIQGCDATYLGTMSFRCVATKDFQRKWFPQKQPKPIAMIEAPAVIFDRNDHVHFRYLAEKFGIQHERPPLHVVPDVTEFARFITAGLGYGLLPTQQVEPLLKDRSLVDIAPSKPWTMKLYWHCWQLQSSLAKGFTKAVVERSKLYIR